MMKFEIFYLDFGIKNWVDGGLGVYYFGGTILVGFECWILLGGLNGRGRDCVISRGNVGLCSYQSLIGTLFVVCETVTHLRRCGGTRLIPEK